MSIYSVDVGFFPTTVIACFSLNDFYRALKLHGVPDAIVNMTMPMEKGIAETHAFSNAGNVIVLVLFNLEPIENDLAYMAGVVAHESVHVLDRVLEHVGENVEEFGEETRAYLMQHLVEQMFQGCIMEIHKRAKRKGNRKTSRKVGSGEGGNVPEVGKPEHDGGPGSDSLVQQENPPS